MKMDEAYKHINKKTIYTHDWIRTELNFSLKLLRWLDPDSVVNRFEWNDPDMVKPPINVKPATMETLSPQDISPSLSWMWQVNWWRSG